MTSSLAEMTAIDLIWASSEYNVSL